MIFQKVTIRHLCFHSPIKEPAKVEFHSGFNLIYGASNTGKSSILDAIDFMLGRSSRKLKEIPEHIGYDEIFLGLEFSNGDHFTLSRSVDGGDYNLLEGLHFSPDHDQVPKILKEKKSTKKLDSLSDFILKKIGLHDKNMKKNAKNQKEKLSIRTLLPLFFATETDIQKELSPYRSAQYTKETMEISRLKLLLTGVDDSALKSSEATEREVISRTARVGMLEELIQAVSTKIEDAIPEDTSKEDLEDQEKRLHNTIESSNSLLSKIENDFLELAEEKQGHQLDYKNNLSRMTEIREMVERFTILMEHYQSDQERLGGIIEAGSLISDLETQSCPVCGAGKEHHGFDHTCDTETGSVVASASIELEKIIKLELELSSTIDQLRAEAGEVGATLQIKRDLLEKSSEKISEITPDLTLYRSKTAELFSKQSIVKRSIELFEAREELEDKLTAISEAPERVEKVTENRVPTVALFDLAERIRKILEDWELPNSAKVHFDPETTDIVLNGKHRISNGKGHRSITHSAMTLAFSKYLVDKTLPNLGFVVLDSPLLAYEEPDDNDEISHTNLNELFFDSLDNNKDYQTIVFENKKSIPDNVDKYPNVIHFTKSETFGRYGFFPTTKPLN